MSFVQQLLEQGFAVELVESRLRISPKDRLTDPLRDWIRSNLAQLIEEVKAGEVNSSSTEKQLTLKNRNRLYDLPAGDSRRKPHPFRVYFAQRADGRMEQLKGFEAIPNWCVQWCHEGDPVWTPT